MSLLPESLRARLGRTGAASVCAPTAEILIAALPVAIALEEAGLEVRLSVLGGGGGGEFPNLADVSSEFLLFFNEWLGDFGRFPNAIRTPDVAGGIADGTSRGLCVAVDGATLARGPAAMPWLGELAERPGAAVAVVALGAERALGIEEDRAPARLSRLAAEGGLLGVGQVGRFGHPGRSFIEAVEHVHHRAGPTGQSVLLDTLRASLFGRHGRQPVNLRCRERPPRVSLDAALVYYLDPVELLRLG